MGKRLRVLALGAALLGGCHPSPPAEVEYEVCRAFLESPYAEKLKESSVYEKQGVFFIYNLDQEDPKAVLAFFKRGARVDLDPRLVLDFVQRNHTPRMIDRRQLPPDIRYDTAFMKKNVYALSRVGFNTGRDEALLYATYSSIAEFGHGSLIHLKKRFGRWRVQKVLGVWVYG